MWTSTKLANRVARYEGLCEEDRTRLHRVFRNMVMKSVIETHVDEDDGRSTQQFDDEAAATALLLFPLAQFSVDVRGQRSARDRIVALDFDGQKLITKAICAVEKGERVDLVLVLRRSGLRGIETSIFFNFEERKDPEVEKILSSYSADFETLATVSISANACLKPLFARE